LLRRNPQPRIFLGNSHDVRVLPGVVRSVGMLGRPFDWQNSLGASCKPTVRDCLMAQF
jgi:hypothetical protein